MKHLSSGGCRQAPYVSHEGEANAVVFGAQIHTRPVASQSEKMMLQLAFGYVVGMCLLQDNLQFSKLQIRINIKGLGHLSLDCFLFPVVQLNDSRLSSQLSLLSVGVVFSTVVCSSHA